MNYEEELDALAHKLITAAILAKCTVSCAESLTAGMTASALAGIPGASAVLRGGAVTYCDEIKHKVLGVKEDTLARYTAVSEEAAREMSEGARELFESDIAVSLTGYAGPDGGDLGKLAGTVYISTSTNVATKCVRCQFEGTRNEVRLQAAAKALELMLLCIHNL